MAYEKRIITFEGAMHRGHFSDVNDPLLSQTLPCSFCWDLNIHNDVDEVNSMIALLRSYNPDKIIGYYNSASTSMPPESDRQPNPAKLHPEDVEDESWYVRDVDGNRVPYSSSYTDRFFLDITKWSVRRAIIEKSIERALSFGLDAVCYDNCYWGQTPYGPTPGVFPIINEDWHEGFKLFIKEASEHCHEAGLLCVPNIAIYPVSAIPDAFDYASDYADGVMSEAAFHPQVRDRIQDELDGYAAALEKGVRVYLFTRYQEDEDMALLAIRHLACKYNVGDEGIFLNKVGAREYNPLHFLDPNEDCYFPPVERGGYWYKTITDLVNNSQGDEFYTNRIKDFVFILQEYIEKYYLSVDDFLSEHDIRVLPVFAEISKSVGYPIDAANIEDV